MDEATKIAVHARDNEVYTTVTEGAFNFERIRQELEGAGFTSGSYRRHETWEGGSIRWEYDRYNRRHTVHAVSLIEASGLVVMAFDTNSLQHFLRAYSGDLGLLINAEEEQSYLDYVKQAMDRVGQGWFMRGEYRGGDYGQMSLGMAMSNGETEHTVKITWALVYGDEEQAEYAGQRFSDVGYLHGLIKVEDVRVDENFVIVVASVDEDDLSLLPSSYFYIQ